MNFFLDKLTAKSIALLLLSVISILICIVYSYYVLRAQPLPPATISTESSIITSPPKTYISPINTPLSSNDDAAKNSILMQTLHAANQSGVIYKSPEVQIEYVAADNLFQAEILTSQIAVAKQEAETWFRLHGISQKGICSLPLFFISMLLLKTIYLQQMQRLTSCLMVVKVYMIKVSMNKPLSLLLLSVVCLFLFSFSPILEPAHAQLSGCGEMDIGNPGANQQPPPQCQGNQNTISCKPTQMPVSYVDAISIGNSRTITATVWNCDHPAPLVVFVPGQGRSAADYARYEKAIAAQGFTVAGMNFSTAENNGHNLQQEVTDTLFLVGELEADTKFNIQNGSVGLVGHSDGGLVTSMEGYLGHNDSNIKAIISADGYAPGSSSGPPLLLLHGSQDQFDGPPNFNGYTANPKYHAEIIGADHFCYVAENSVPGYAIDCATANLQKQTQALDAITVAFLQHELLGCNNSLQDVANQYKGYITLEQSGNTGGGHSCDVVSGGITNPFPDGFQTTRLDMGEDGTFKNRIVAPFAGTITYASNSFSNWGGYIELKADQRPAGLPTSTLYFAEGVGVVVPAGTHVQAGQQIAKPVPSVWNGILGNIEWGMAQDGTGLTDTYSKVVSNPRQMVLDFAKWADALHVPPPTSTDHAGYP